MRYLRNFLEKILPADALARVRSLYHFLLAFLAALRYGFPARRMKIIGVTGTKGKTTVVHLAHEILQGSGAKVASISSLRFRVGDEERTNELKMTMPGRFFIQKFLRDAKKAGCIYVVLEVTSQGIAQFRHRFIPFHAAVMTNVAPEHLEAHGGFEPYLRSKLDLFWRLSKDAIALINRDDPLWERFSAATPAHKIFYGKEGIVKNGVRTAVSNVKITDRGIRFDCDNHTITSPLLGEFNFYDILAAVAVGAGEHIAFEKIAAGISRITGMPGRMEFIRREPFAVVVDYAHTPDSLKKVYTFLRESGSALVCVLGAAGGGRDRWKRPEFGRIAEEFCGEIILTNEDPYDENPQEIVNEMAKGMARTSQIIMDRREAIHHALSLARRGDAVLITGKGTDPFIMGPRGSKTPWSDASVVREELKKLL